MLQFVGKDFSATSPWTANCKQGATEESQPKSTCFMLCLLLSCCCQQADVEVAQARIHQLQEELASKEGQLRYKLNANELQLKEQIVYNVRTAVAEQVSLAH